MKLGFIGAGNMAGAIISGLLGAGGLKSAEMGVYDVNSEKVKEYGDKGLKIYDNPARLVSECRYVLLAVKPQNFEELLPRLRDAVTGDTVIISIAAGISASYIKSVLGQGCRVIQAMPNTPLLVGKGSVAISRVEPVTDEEFEFACGLFQGASGTVEPIDNRLMNEVITLNGSSPAYIYLFAKVLVERAVELGFDPDCANRLICQALIGSAEMMLHSGKSHQELIDMVTSPGGTTFAGLEALKENRFSETLRACYDATTKRAYELGK